MLAAEVDRTYDMLVNTVARSRSLAESAVRGTEAGLLFGSDAVNTKLADRIGTRQDALADLRAALSKTSSNARAALSAPIQPKGESSMNEETRQAEPSAPAVDLAAIHTKARAEGYAEAREIVELCVLAKMLDKAPALLAKNAAVDDVRKTLLEARVAADSAEIQSHTMPDTGTSAKPSLENNPVVQAVERLTGKGVK